MTRAGQIVLLLTLLTPLSLQAEEVEEKDEDRRPPVTELTLDEVPPAALAAARKEKPDVYFKSAERLIWKDEPIYRIIGVQFRNEWSVYVNVQGEIWEVERDAIERTNH